MGDSAKPWGLAAALGASAHDSSKPWLMPMSIAGNQGDSAQAWDMPGSAGTYNALPPYRDLILGTAGLVGYWRLDEPSGTSAADSKGSNTGTATAGVTVNVAGALPDDAAMRFDGTQGKIAFANPALTADFTVEGWVYILGPGSVGSTDYSCFLGADATHRLLLRNTTGEILFQMGGGNLTAPAATIALDQWVHVAYTRTGSTQKLYVNGVLITTLSNAGASLNLPFWLGSYLVTSANYSFNGRMDEVAIYNVVLTDQQILDRVTARAYAVATATTGPPPIQPTQPFATNAASILPISTPDASGQVVEPCIEYIPGGWNGHNWWALITGYTNSDSETENPSLYYSDNGTTWTPAPGVAFPVDPSPTPGNNADPELRLGPDGNLHGFWIRFGNPINRTGVYHCVFSVAGAGNTNASAVGMLFDSLTSTEQVTGPVVLFDPDNNRWIMWYMDAHNNAAPYPMMRRTCPGTDPAGTWSVPTTCTLNGVPNGRSPWEKHVERYGSQLHMITTFCDNGTGGGNTTLHFGVSNDNGFTWIFNPIPLLSSSSGGWDNAVAYRGDIGPVLAPNIGLYGLWYSGKSSGGVWRWGYTTIKI